MLVLSALSYHPLFADTVTENAARNPLSKYIILLAVVNIIISVDLQGWMRCLFIKRFLLLSLLSFFSFWILSVVFLNVNYSDAVNILMALSFILIGYSLKGSNQCWGVISFIYALVLLYSCFMQIQQNLGGFVIQDVYMQYGKNQLGLMTSTVAVVFSSFTIICEKRYVKVVVFCIAIIALLFTITIRARAAFLTTFLIILFLLSKQLSKIQSQEHKVRFLFLTLIVFVLLLSSPTIMDYIFNSFMQNQGDDLSSGRIERNYMAMDIINASPFFGNLEINAVYPTIHNYVLRIMADYGFVGAFFLLSLYLYFGFYVCKSAFKSEAKFDNVGVLAILLPLILSFEEPTYPYAPGTAVVYPFLLFGMSLNRRTII